MQEDKLVQGLFVKRSHDGKNVYFVAVIYMNELDVTCKIQCSCGMTGWVQYKPEAIICCATALVYKAFFCYLKSA